MTLTLDGRRTAGAYARHPSDLYPTGQALGETLPQLVDLGPYVWECAAGEGHLVRELVAAGIRVVATDLMGWGCGREGVDFLKTRRLFAPVIATNPPFSLWQEFAEHALSLRPRLVVLLGRVLLLEGAGVGRLFDKHLVEHWVSRRRVNLGPPGMLDKGHNTKLAFSWYVLQPDKPAHLGDGWITRGFTPRLISKASSARS